MNQPPKFTPEQVDWVCFQIGEWYLKWRSDITEPTVNGYFVRFGSAKEDLKLMICPEYPKEEENEGPAD